LSSWNYSQINNQYYPNGYNHLFSTIFISAVVILLSQPITKAGQDYNDKYATMVSAVLVTPPGVCINKVNPLLQSTP